MPSLEVGSLELTPQQILAALHHHFSLKLHEEARKRVRRSRKIVESQTRPAYAINTGLGSLKNKVIGPSEQARLSENVIRSHACGSGRPLPLEVSQLMLLLRIHTLSLGFSGVRLKLIEKLIELYENQLFGVIYEHGSVGSSGDLVPLAHLALPLLGEGEVWVEDQIGSARKVLRDKKITPFKLASKEGVSLINGTQFMTALGLILWERGEKLLNSANVVAALSLEALRGSRNAFHPFLHSRRPIPEIQETAAFLYKLLAKSRIIEDHKDCGEVQDAYSLRCIPQVHSTVKIALNNLLKILTIEIGSSTDNPLVSIESGEILSGGNFHGEPLAHLLDGVGTAFTKLAAISERRTARLVDHHLSGLPEFLVEASGLNSGLMIPQYTAASIVGENRILSHPASADSIPTSANQEDINSMGSISAKKGMKILENTEQVIGIELLTALQALDLSLKNRRGLKSSPPLEVVRSLCRKKIPYLQEDRYLKPLIDEAIQIVRSGCR